MADILIEGVTALDMHEYVWRSPVFWRTNAIGYQIFINSTGNLTYRKTVDGGQNWGGANVIVNAVCDSSDCWAQWDTPGNTGTIIYIVYRDQSVNHEIALAYLDVSDDSNGRINQIEACQGTGVMRAVHNVGNWSSVTVSKSGRIYVTGHYQDNAATWFYFDYYSDDNGASWNAIAASWWGSPSDSLSLFPDCQSSDGDDVWGIRGRAGAFDDWYLMIYDASANNWGSWMIKSVTSINEVAVAVRSSGGCIRHSDGHLIVALMTEIATVNGSIEVYDIYGSGSITQLTNARNGDAANVLICPDIFINQKTNELYCTYLYGTYNVTMNAYYVKSSDGGASWGAPTQYSVTSQDDFKWASAARYHPSNGGRMAMSWTDEDDRDLYYNYDNSIVVSPGIFGAGAPWPSIAIKVLAGTAGLLLLLGLIKKNEEKKKPPHYQARAPTRRLYYAN